MFSVTLTPGLPPNLNSLETLSFLCQTMVRVPGALLCNSCVLESGLLLSSVKSTKEM